MTAPSNQSSLISQANTQAALPQSATVSGAPSLPAAATPDAALPSAPDVSQIGDERTWLSEGTMSWSDQDDPPRHPLGRDLPVQHVDSGEVELVAA